MSRPARIATLATLGLLTTTPALAQSDDGWDIASANGARFAYAEYSSGQTITVQCRGQDLQIAITGLPVVEINPDGDTIGSRFTVYDTATSHPIAHLEVDKEHPTTGLAIMPARLGRALKTGRPITIRAKDQPDIVLAIPTDTRGIQDRLTDCNVPLSDENDQRTIRGLSSMDVLVRVRNRFFSRIPYGTYQITTQCAVASDWKLQDCQTARQLPSNPRHDAVLNEMLNGLKIKPEEVTASQLTVEDLVIFNYISTTTTEMRPSR